MKPRRKKLFLRYIFTADMYLTDSVYIATTPNLVSIRVYFPPDILVGWG